MQNEDIRKLLENTTYKDYSLVDFISDVCVELEVDIPVICDMKEHSTNDLNKLFALYSPVEDILYIKIKYNHTLDLYFAVAHEIRHKWQLQNDKEKYFSNYKEAAEFKNMKYYNLQLAEIDANAFAQLIMADTFNVYKKFKNMSNTVNNEIEKRIKYIVNNEYEIEL